MKAKQLYIISVIVIAIPWLFLLEVFPIPYHRISTLAEVVLEGAMFIALVFVTGFLRKDLKRLKAIGDIATDSKKNTSGRDALGKTDANSALKRAGVRMLFYLACITLFLLGLILLILAISFSLL